MRRRTALLILVTTLTVAACSPDRPTVEQWSTRWRDTASIIPNDARSGVEEASCESVVAELRTARQSVLPAPDDDLEQAADRWLLFAEDVFFECPPREGSHVGWSEAITELDRLAAEVDVQLRLQAP